MVGVLYVFHVGDDRLGVETVLLSALELTFVELLALHAARICLPELRYVSIAWIIRLGRMMSHFRELRFLFG